MTTERRRVEYPEEISAFIFSNYRQAGYVRMARMVNEKFGTDYTVNHIQWFLKKNGLKCDVDSKFKKGHAPINPFKKGNKPHPNTVACQFQKGHIPKTQLPVGTIRRKANDYYRIKIADPDKWKLLHVYLWEKENGPLPEGHCLMFLDGDKTNCTLDNLKLISRRENAIMNQKQLRAHSTELNEAALATAKVIARIKDYEKGKG